MEENRIKASFPLKFDFNTEEMLKISSCQLQLYLTPEEEVEFSTSVTINHPKHPLSKARVISLPASIESKVPFMKKLTQEKIAEAENRREISISSIWIKALNMKFEIICKGTDSLHSLKEQLFREIENAFFVKLNQILGLEDLRLSCRKTMVLPVLEGKPLDSLFDEWDPFRNALVGNILSLEAFCPNRKKEHELIRLLMLGSKPGESEKLQTVIKFWHPAGKLVNKILVVEEDERTLCLHLMKIYGEIKISFPLDVIDSLSVASEVEKAEIHRLLPDFEEIFVVRLIFIEMINWENMTLVFLSGEQCDRFRAIFAEFREKRLTRKKFSLQDNKSRIQNAYKETIWSKEEGKSPGRHRPSMLENLMHSSLSMNALLKDLTTNEKEETSEKKSEEGCEALDRRFVIKQSKSIFGKSEKVCGFCKENQDLQFFRVKKQSEKFLYSYLLCEIKEILALNERKLNIIFKNKAKIRKKLGNLILKFQTPSEAIEFTQIFKVLSKQRPQKMQQQGPKDFLKQNIKRYSWFYQNFPSLSALAKKRETAEWMFLVINENMQPSRQLLHLNLIHNIISFLRKDESIITEIVINNISTISLDYLDHRKLTILLENKKQYDIIFASVRHRFYFESAISSILYANHNLKTLQSSKDGKFVNGQKLLVYATTWNVGFSEPPTTIAETSRDFLAGFDQYHIVAIGLQECDPGSWIELFQRLFRKKFSLVNIVTMWKMSLCVFIKKSYINYVKNLEVMSKPTGIANIIGNKGGVLISFRVHDTSFCFISCHLAAQQSNEGLRKANYHDLIKSLRVGVKELEACFQFDYIFWMGDFNFRIDHPFEKTVQAIEEKNWDFLRTKCQLQKMRNTNQLFSDFLEADIKFKPTYRRLRDDSKAYSNKKGQPPSWTDRVFFRASPNHSLKVIDYNSKEFQYGSDHRPVFGIFETEAHYPFVSEDALLFLEKNENGIFRINRIEISYSLGTLKEVLELNGLAYPFELNVSFYGNYLKNFPCCSSLLVSQEEDGSRLAWKEEEIPLVHAAVTEEEFLRRKLLYFVVHAIKRSEETDNEILLGQMALSLSELMDNKGKKTLFAENVSLFGRVLGEMSGEIEYEIYELDDLKQ